jgi:hypothetical protein
MWRNPRQPEQRQPDQGSLIATFGDKLSAAITADSFTITSRPDAWSLSGFD